MVSSLEKRQAFWQKPHLWTHTTTTHLCYRIVALYQILTVIFDTEFTSIWHIWPLLLSFSSHEWTLEKELHVLFPRAETCSIGKHWMWKDVFSWHHPGSAVPHLAQCLADLPGATGHVWGQDCDSGGGAEMVLGRRKDGGERQAGDGQSDGAVSIRPACFSAAGAGSPVHRGWLSLCFHFLISNAVIKVIFLVVLKVKDMLVYVLFFYLSLLFPDGESCACRAERVVWGGGDGTHSGPADLWGLLDGKNRSGIWVVHSVSVAVVECKKVDLFNLVLMLLIAIQHYSNEWTIIRDNNMHFSQMGHLLILQVISTFK